MRVNVKVEIRYGYKNVHNNFLTITDIDIDMANKIY